MQQLKALSKPFADKLVQRKPGGSGGDYVSHSTVIERALSVVGPFSMENVQLIRGYAPEEKTKSRTYPAQDGVVVGALITIRCVIDGREVSITEAGDVENPLQKGNDGSRAKDAISDAVKRCWMRAGLGLHLWSQQDYFLHKLLERDFPGAQVYTPEELGQAVDGEGNVIDVEAVETPQKAPEQPAPTLTAEASAEAPQKAAEATIGEKRGAGLLAELQKLGLSDTEVFALADKATGTQVQNLGDLTEEQAVTVWNEGRKPKAA